MALTDELFAQIGRLVADHAGEAYFVGGCVRDLLRGEPIKDVDFALAGNTHNVGRALADHFHGHVFWLHQEEGVVRVALPEQDGLQIDLCPLRGTLQEDLQARDLTVNAMAIAAREGLHPGAGVLDPTGGRGDLKARRIRFVTPGAPEADPLRTLRALRFKWKLGFELDAETASRVRECVPLLQRVSVERVRDELFQLLSVPAAAEALTECWAFGKNSQACRRTTKRLSALLRLAACAVVKASTPSPMSGSRSS
jgi:poly(A) polymerase